MARPTPSVRALKLAATYTLFMSRVLAQSSSVTSLLFLGFDPQPLVASVVAANPTATTYSIGCAPGPSASQCGVINAQITEAPSAYDFYMAVGTGLTVSAHCTVSGGIPNQCIESAAGPLAHKPGVTTTTVQSSDFAMMQVTINAGLEKLTPASSSMTSATSGSSSSSATTVSSTSSSGFSSSSLSSSSSIVSMGSSSLVSSSATVTTISAASALPGTQTTEVPSFAAGSATSTTSSTPETSSATMGSPQGIGNGVPSGTASSSSGASTPASTPTTPLTAGAATLSAGHTVGVAMGVVAVAMVFL